MICGRMKSWGPRQDHREEGRPWQSVDLSRPRKGELSTAPDLPQSSEDVQLLAFPAT